MSGDEFARVLAEAAEAQPRELPRGERMLAELRAEVARVNAARLARWLAHAPEREEALATYRRVRAEAGLDPDGAGPWAGPPPPITIF